MIARAGLITRLLASVCCLSFGAQLVSAQSGTPISLSVGIPAASECVADPIDDATVYGVAQHVFAAGSSASDLIAAYISSSNEGLTIKDETEAGGGYPLLTVVIDGEIFVDHSRIPELAPAASTPDLIDDQVALEISTMLRERAACGNAGEWSRWLTFFSPTGLEQYIAAPRDPAATLEDWRQVSLNHTKPSDDSLYIAPVVLAAREASDGRVVAYGFFDMNVSNAANIGDQDLRQPNMYVFVRIGEQWRIDAELPDLLPVQLSAPSPAASPIAAATPSR